MNFLSCATLSGGIGGGQEEEKPAPDFVCGGGYAAGYSVRFLAEQTPAVTEKYGFTFRSPVCDPTQFDDSLGSDTLPSVLLKSGTHAISRIMC